MTIEVSSWTDLDAIRDDLSGDYVLTTDLDSSDSDYAGLGDDWTPIGGLDSEVFNGLRFDGNGHSIEDLVVNPSGQDFVGLFGGGGGDDGEFDEIADLALEVTIDSDVSNTGGLAGFVGRGSVRRVFVDATITGSADRSGGICGGHAGNVLTDSYILGSVTGGSTVGGVVGTSGFESADLRRCWAAVDMDGDLAVGAIAGRWTGDVGPLWYDETVFPVGIADNGLTSNSATGLTTAEMQGLAAADNMAALAFAAEWSEVVGAHNADADGYPILRTIDLDTQDAGQTATIESLRMLARDLSTAASNDPDIDEATVTLAWTDSAVGEDGYRIYRSSLSSPTFPDDFTVLTETQPDTETHNDDSAAFDESYEYRVAAFEGDGEATPRAAETIAVGSPGPFTVQIVGTNSPVGVGEPLELDVELTNQGDLEGETTVEADLTEQ